MWAQEILAESERVKEKKSGVLWGIYQGALKEGWTCQHKRKTEREASHGAKVKGKWGRVFSLIGKKGSAKKAADVAQGLGKGPHEPVGPRDPAGPRPPPLPPRQWARGGAFGFE